MLYREAAVRISQSVLLVSRELSDSVSHMFAYQKEGKVNEEQAASHLHKVQVVVAKLIEEILDPIAAEYPDLRPHCCGCESRDDQ